MSVQPGKEFEYESEKVKVRNVIGISRVTTYKVRLEDGREVDIVEPEPHITPTRRADGWGHWTKWDLIGDAERKSLDTIQFTGQSCSGCGESLATEGDFARHFVLDDTRYLNLGNCPVKDAK